MTLVLVLVFGDDARAAAALQGRGLPRAPAVHPSGDSEYVDGTDTVRLVPSSQEGPRHGDVRLGRIANPGSDASGTADPLASEYRPGVCNIGPAEIAARRRVGHAGLIATVAAWVALAVAGAPSWVRLVAARPAALAASGYLQAWLHFCAGFGARGVFNFGSLGRTQPVEALDARARDRRKATQIGLASLLVGIAVGVMAVLLPR